MCLRTKQTTEFDWIDIIGMETVDQFERCSCQTLVFFPVVIK